jgi:hypothetical protein
MVIKRQKADFKRHSYLYAERVAINLQRANGWLMNTAHQNTGDGGSSLQTVVSTHAQQERSFDNIAGQESSGRNPLRPQSGRGKKHTGFRAGGTSPCGTTKSLPVYPKPIRLFKPVMVMASI